jgi:hypothetical protein
MTRHTLKSSRFAIGFLTALLALAATALAGPPLICHPIDIGSAQSLPWSNPATLTGLKDYDASHLIADTLTLLGPNTPVLVRMETLRRATIYAQRDPVIAKQLFLKLQERTTTNEKDALAAFDFGYLAACYKQIQWARSKSMTVWGQGEWSNPGADVDGYGFVKKAIRMRGQDAEMEFAAAMITTEGSQSEHQEHLRNAMAGAKGDSLLSENLANQFSKTAKN